MTFKKLLILVLIDSELPIFTKRERKIEMWPYSILIDKINEWYS